MVCDMIHDCTDESYQGWFETFCCGNFQECSTWMRKNTPRLTPSDWLKRLNLKKVDELYRRNEPKGSK